MRNDAKPYLDVSADNFGDDDVLGDAVLDGLGGGNLDGDGQRFGDKGDTVGLGLVFLTAVLVLTSSVVISVTRRAAGGNLHGFSFLLISHLWIE